MNFFTPKGKDKTRLCNFKRVARAWMEQYEILYNFTLSPSKLQEDCGDVSHVQEIKKNLTVVHISLWFLRCPISICHNIKHQAVKKIFSSCLHPTPAQSQQVAEEPSRRYRTQHFDYH